MGKDETDSVINVAPGKHNDGSMALLKRKYLFAPTFDGRKRVDKKEVSIENGFSASVPRIDNNIIIFDDM